VACRKMAAQSMASHLLISQVRLAAGALSSTADPLRHQRGQRERQQGKGGNRHGNFPLHSTSISTLPVMIIPHALAFTELGGLVTFPLPHGGFPRTLTRAWRWSHPARGLQLAAKLPAAGVASADLEPRPAGPSVARHRSVSHAGSWAGARRGGGVDSN
jgi:hypothetical protein